MLRWLTAAAVLVAGIAVPETAVRADTVSRSVLSDEFTGSVGNAPNSAKWVVAGDPRSAQLTGDGQLWLATRMQAQKPITQTSGRAEARIRMDRDGGAWRALGVLTANGQLPAGQVEVLGDDQVDGFDFHTYVIDWSPTALVWSVDGRKVLRFTPQSGGQPLLLALNSGSGGRNPDTMLVDYVRVSARVTVQATNWKTYTTYKAGKYVRYDGVVYRVRELHTSLPGWQPPLVPGLFQKV
ncbi:carbohydrate-binding protein [Actinoplanes sp. NPDC051861]|uniref:carbohydrate-binding protein n=1 Tax=Actinoplanes sp. NPDC051861 TaxID=3155170 RepID=UPI0034274D47